MLDFNNIFDDYFQLLMSPNTKYLARTMFKLKVHESNGFAYENLFGQVMQYSRPNFIKIEPYGNQGDRGNDGYEKTEGRYFQVYAPKDATKSLQAAITKIAEDFEEKLIPYWGKFCEVKEYIFVLNDKYQGSNFPIESSLANLKNKHKLFEASLYRSSHLEDEFLALATDQIMMIVGGLPDENSVEGLDYSVVAEVMQHIQNNPITNSHDGKLVLPDIDEKISFNGLVTSGHWLKAKQAETWQIDDYFFRNSTFAKQDLRNHLSQLYVESISSYPEVDGGNNDGIGDIRFVAILEKIAPITDVPAHDRLRRDVGLVIMAKYFETCDIFEEPINAIT